MTGTPIPLTDYVWKTIVELSTPFDGATVILDDWWEVDVDGRVAFYNPVRRDLRRVQHSWGSPQANRDERIARGFAKRTPWAVDVVHVPVAYHYVDLRDFMDG